MALLCNLNASKNFDYPYWDYSRFFLDDWSDEECRSDHRFYKANVYRLFEVLNIPEVLIIYNQSKFHGMEAFCIFWIDFPIHEGFLTWFHDLGNLFQNLTWCQMPSQMIFTIDHPWHRPVLLQEYSPWKRYMNR